MLTTPSGITTEVRCSQIQNALSPIDVTPWGITILVIPLPEKVISSIEVRLFDNVISSRFVQPSNALDPREVFVTYCVPICFD